MSKRIAKSKIIMLQKERRTKRETEKTVCWLPWTYFLKGKFSAPIDFMGLQKMKDEGPLFWDVLKKFTNCEK